MDSAKGTLNDPRDWRTWVAAIIGQAIGKLVSEVTFKGLKKVFPKDGDR